MNVGKDLLNVPVEKGKWERPAPGQIAVVDMPADISLQLCQIARSPGAENRRSAAPDQEIREDMRKGAFSLKIMFRHMDDIAGHIVQLSVQYRADGLMKGSDLLKRRI